MIRTRPAVSGPLRTVRGVILGLAMILLSAGSHSAAQGRLPEPISYLLLGPLCVGLGIIAIERRRGLVWFLAFSLGVQALLHLLLTVTSAHASHQSSPVPSTRMLLAHALAACLFSLLLAGGDARLLRWVSYMCTQLFSAPSTPKMLAPRGALSFANEGLAISPLSIEHAIARRGPPLSRR